MAASLREQTDRPSTPASSQMTGGWMRKTIFMIISGCFGRIAGGLLFCLADEPGASSRRIHPDSAVDALATAKVKDGKSWDRLQGRGDRKSTRLNSSHLVISYAVFCLKKKKEGGELFHDFFDDESVTGQLSQECIA